MFKLFLIITTFIHINAAGYGSRLGLGKSSGYSGLSGGINAILNSRRSGSSSTGLLTGGYFLGSGATSGHSGPIPAAIESRRTVELVPVHIPQEPYVPQIIEVPANELPVSVVFRSQSSRVLVEQLHTPGAPGEVRETHSEDEPHILRHEVIRPVIQELHEVIQPHRRVIQEIQPVIEEIHQVVAKGEPRQTTAPVYAISADPRQTTAPVYAISADVSPIRASAGRLLGTQQIIGSLSGQNLFGSLGTQKVVVPIGGQRLGGALAGLFLDNGLINGVNDGLNGETNYQTNYGTNLLLTNTLPVNIGMIGTKYLEKRTALNSFLSKRSRPSLGISPPRIDLGGAAYVATSFKLLQDSSASKSKAKAKAA